jgi:excisionase family DNA binding protein
VSKLLSTAPDKEATLDPIAVTVPTALKLSGLGRTKLYELIAMKQIRSVRVGARRLIDFASLKAFLTSREA